MEKLRTIAVAAVGSLIGVVGTNYVQDTLLASDDRPAFPEGLVCATPLRQGESPSTLADDSLFKANGKVVLRRSQFLNPQAALDMSRGDEGHFDGEFNVSRVEPNNTKSEVFRYGRRTFATSDCVTAPHDRQIVSKYPTIEAAGKILGSTDVVMEEPDRPLPLKSWRCGAIAISKSILLLPRDYNSDPDLRCYKLVSGQADHDKLPILNDYNTDDWRYVQTANRLTPADIDFRYQPKDDEVLIFSGYAKGGSRQYFRVRYETKAHDEWLITAGWDLIYPEPNTQDHYDYGEVQGPTIAGSGGIYTLEGKLVAIVDREASILPYGRFDWEYEDSVIRPINIRTKRWLADIFKYDIDKHDLDPPLQYISARTLASVDRTKVQPDQQSDEPTDVQVQVK